MKTLIQKIKNKSFNTVLLLTGSLFLIACQKDSDESSTPLIPTPIEIRLTDAPGDYDEVNIDLQQIQVQNANGSWKSLSTNAGIYNLLDFRNGLDTLIVSDSVYSNRVNQIRFVLGNNNSVLVDGQSYFLKVPSGQSSGLKLLVNETLTPGIKYSFLLDFDVAMSVVLKGNDDYSLKPVIKVITEGQNAILKGTLSPATAAVQLYAVQGMDTLGGAVSDSTGFFQINGLQEGVYSLIINPTSPYVKDTLTNITLVNGSVNDLGTIILKM